MKLIKKLSMVVVLMAIFAFSAIESTDLIGKYGDKEAVKMELNLMENGAFTYSDKSDSNKAVNAKGTWTYEKNEITLSNYGDVEIPSTWKYNEKDGAIKAKKGMTFYRLTDSKTKSCCSSKGEAKSCGSKDKK